MCVHTHECVHSKMSTIEYVPGMYNNNNVHFIMQDYVSLRLFSDPVMVHSKISCNYCQKCQATLHNIVQTSQLLYRCP